MNRLLLMGLVLLLLAACGSDRTASRDSATGPSRSKPAALVNDFRIVPGSRVGPVRATTTEADLLRQLGKEVVTTGDTIYGPEGTEWIGTTLYKGRPDQVHILYRDSLLRRQPELVLIRTELTDADGRPLPNPSPGRWATADGLRVGTTLRALEHRNGRPFRLWGFAWDYGGAVSSWQGGRFDAGPRTALTVTLGPGPDLTPAQARALDRVLGDREFGSTSSAMQVLNPRVQSLQVRLNP